MQNPDYHAFFNTQKSTLLKSTEPPSFVLIVDKLQLSTIFLIITSVGKRDLTLEFKSHPPLFIDSGKRKYSRNNPATQIRLINTGEFNSGLISHPVHQITFLVMLRR